MKAQVTWILVADESGGAVLAEKGSRIAQPPVVAIKPDAGGRRQDDIMADRPGRSFSSSGRRRSSMEPPTDPVRILEQDFASKISEVLEDRRAAGAFDRLIVVAPPRMLGDLRRAFPKALYERIAGEFAKDLTKLPQKELAAALQEMFATMKV